MNLLIIAPSSKSIYQSLANEYAAIETNIWAGLLANAVRNDCNVRIFDNEVSHHSALEVVMQDVKPDLVLFVVTGQNPNASTAAMDGAVSLSNYITHEEDYKEFYGFKIAFVGPHVNALPVETLEREVEIDICLTNEGVYALKNLVNGGLSDLNSVKGIVWRDGDDIVVNPPEIIVPQDRLEVDLPGVAYDLMPMLTNYRTSSWHANYIDEDRSPFASIYTSLGCPMQCLRGDTPINTIYGDIPIEELAKEYDSVPVYTWDFQKQKVCISDAINIKKTGSNRKLVRITFDDGTHIDCTPDHKFVCFKNGNQHAPTKEWISEAQDIQPKTSVRAYKTEVNKKENRATISWGRRKRQLRGRMILEYLIGRELIGSEMVHHIDHNSLNDSPNNLELVANQKEHLKNHPEIAEKMRNDNPVKYYTEESREKIRKAVTGKKRSLEQRKRYRESKLGSKNPNYVDGHSCGQPSRIEQINHKVVSVEEIDGVHDVYCMTVPGHDWFFANNVLVKNCSFCMINIINRTNNDWSNAAANFNVFRHWSPEFLIKQFDYLASQGVKQIKIADELFVLRPRHFIGLCDLLIERDYGFNIWAYSRIDTVKEKYLEKLKAAGVNWLALGIESANQTIRQEITKGKFKDINIRDVVKMIEDAGINVMGNYIFGLGHDSHETMQQTLDLAMELNTVAMNCYAATPLPGSPLYLSDKAAGKEMPQKYSEFGFLSYDHKPSCTEYLTNKEVLAFRDQAWDTYHKNPRFLSRVKEKFGPQASEEINKMTSVKIKRQILEAKGV